MEQRYAPVVVFAYNRPEHLKNVLQSLKECKEASKSEVYIFIDGPKNEGGIDLNKKVENVAHSFELEGFKKVTITNSVKNKGLAKSIIDGVDNVIKKYGKVIVVEDDIKVSPYFLFFMNNALNYYEDNPQIWSVGGYIVPLKLPPHYNLDYITTQRVSSVAWGTWADRWRKIDWQMKCYNSYRKNLFKRIAFNKWGKDRASMLDDQMEGKIDSWAIRFDYAMFANDTYNIVPVKSLVNIAFDGGGTHNKVVSEGSKKYKVDLRNGLCSYKFGMPIVSWKICNSFNLFYRLPWAYRAKKFVERIILK